MCCPPINQFGREDRMSPQLAEKMLDVIASAEMGPMPLDFTDKVLALCAARQVCNFEYLEYHGQPCGRENSVLCQGENGCIAVLCDHHQWVCPACFKTLCSWCLDQKRHDCQRAA